MSLRITRRRWAAVLAVTPALAQTAPPAAPVAPNVQQPLDKAYADVHDASVRLMNTDVPMDIEPAFLFKV